MTAIPLGRGSPPGSVPPTRRLREPRQRRPTWCCCAQRLPVSPSAGLAPQRVAARFGLAPDFARQAARSTGLRRRLTEHLPRTPHRLVSVALILTLRWTAVSCCAALCSPDLPPAPCFHELRQRRSGLLHPVIIAVRFSHFDGAAGVQSLGLHLGELLGSVLSDSEARCVGGQTRPHRPTVLLRVSSPLPPRSRESSFTPLSASAPKTHCAFSSPTCSASHLRTRLCRATLAR